MSDDGAELERLVLRFGSRYQFDESHGRSVARLVVALADRLEALHDLGAEDRLLLCHAGLIHDVGYFVAGRRHHRHSEYLVREDETLRDYPQPARLRLSLLVRGHRKRLPELPVGWSRKEVGRFEQAAALLRIADGLDYAHDGAAAVVACHVGPRMVVIEVAGAEPTSTQRVLRRKAALFAHVFGRAVSMVAIAAPESAG